VQGKVLRSAGVGLGMLFVVVAAGHPGAVSAAAAGPAWTAYVATAQGVDPIDTATNTAGDAISGHGLGPVQLAVTPDDSTVYVVNDTFSTVIPMDTANNTPGTPIPVGDDPYGIAVTPDGATVYVASQRSDTVAAIDTATNTVRATIPVAGEPTGVAITPDGKTVYVSDFEANTVTPIDIATNTAGTPIPVGVQPAQLAITPDGSTAYVADAGAGTVTPIDLAANTVGTPITVVSPSAYESLFAMAMTPDGSTVYAVSPSAANVTPIDTATNTIGTPIPLPIDPTGIGITPDGTTAYVAWQGGVVSLNLATGTVGVEVAGITADPDGIAVSPDQAPIASLAVVAGQPGATTNFHASDRHVAFGSVAGYAWNFGDGTSARSTTPNTSHVYARAGSYRVTVTETTTGGTSTNQVFTGQTVSRNGSRAAVASATFNVGAEVSIPDTGAGLLVPAGVLVLLGLTLAVLGVVRRRR
jgi:YVTN family beta-propeller protein